MAAVLPDPANPDFELSHEVVEEVKRRNDMLELENSLFESYLRRAAERNPGAFTGDDDVQSAAAARKQGVMKKATLEWHQKNEVGVHEMDDIREDIEKLRAEHEALIDALRAQMEETDIRISEIKKDAYEFKRDVVIGAENARTGKTVAEKVVRHMDEKIRAKGSMIEKLRLKNAQLKAQVAKLESQLQQKEDMGEVLHAIDFDQLKIENQQYLEKIEDRNNELLRLKLTTGNTIQVLNEIKHKLGVLNEESVFLKSETAHRREALAKINEEIKRVEAERERALRAERKAKREVPMHETSKMPQVLEYVQQKSEEFELQKQIAAITKKIDLAQMALKTEMRRSRQTGSF